MKNIEESLGILLKSRPNLLLQGLQHGSAYLTLNPKPQTLKPRALLTGLLLQKA